MACACRCKLRPRGAYAGGETTLNAASTAAAQGALDLAAIIAMGALGAIVGDSALSGSLAARRSGWPAAREAARQRQDEAGARDHGHDAPLLIVGGRYVPGMRWFVNATMGLSDIPYRRFLPWSVLGGVLWSAYTCLLAYKVSTTLAEFPIASAVISGVVTTVILAAISLVVRRRRPAVAASGGPESTR